MEQLPTRDRLLESKKETGRSNISLSFKEVNPRINNFPKLKYQF